MRDAIGYPVHALAEYREWTNEHGVTFVDWRAHCGAVGKKAGRAAQVTRDVRSARRLELCPACWPNGHRTYHPAPVSLTADARTGRG